VKEGATTIGNVIIDDIDARQTDGFIAIGTHGNGVYSSYYTPEGMNEPTGNPRLQIGNVFPNPVTDRATVELNAERNLKLKVRLYSNNGNLVKEFDDKAIHAGKQLLSYQVGGFPAGLYFLVFESEKERLVKKLVKVDG